MMVRSLVALERFLMPNACIVCGGGVSTRAPDRLICAVCVSRARRLPGGCSRCHQPMPPVGPCRFCAEWAPRLQCARSGFWLGNETRAIVHHLKYENCPGLATLMASMMASALPRPPRGWLIPIPLGRRRLRHRAYNQSERLARQLGTRWALPVAPNALYRPRETQSQTALTPEARLANVAEAFVAPAPPASTQRGHGSQARWAILVDDVLTTGATLDAAARALAAAGWPLIGALSFARAKSYEMRVLDSVTAK